MVKIDNKKKTSNSVKSSSLNKNKSSISKNQTSNPTKSSHHENFKEELLKIDNDEDKYDKLFEQKLASQYREFRNIKDHSTQSKKFFKVVGVLIIIILAVLLVMSFG